MAAWSLHRLLSLLILATCLSSALGLGAGAHSHALKGTAQRQTPHGGLQRLRRSTAAVSSDFSVNQLFNTAVKVCDGIKFTVNIFNPCKPYGVVDCDGLCASAKKQIQDSTEAGVNQLKDCGKKAKRQLRDTGESLSKLFVKEPAKRGKTMWEDGDPILKAKMGAKQMSLKR